MRISDWSSDVCSSDLTANANFLGLMGYRLEEIAGKHHRIFCAHDHAQSQDYADFWQKLGSGAFDAGAYERRDRDGREIWLQATYNPDRKSTRLNSSH